MKKVALIGCAGAYVATRFGVFGERVIRLNLDDKNPRVSTGIFTNTAYWDPGDCYLTVYTSDIRPIRFEKTADYSNPFAGPEDERDHKD